MLPHLVNIDKTITEIESSSIARLFYDYIEDSKIIYQKWPDAKAALSAAKFEINAQTAKLFQAFPRDEYYERMLVWSVIQDSIDANPVQKSSPGFFHAIRSPREISKFYEKELGNKDQSLENIIEKLISEKILNIRLEAILNRTLDDLKQKQHLIDFLNDNMQKIYNDLAMTDPIDVMSDVGQFSFQLKMQDSLVELQKLVDFISGNLDAYTDSFRRDFISIIYKLKKILGIKDFSKPAEAKKILDASCKTLLAHFKDLNKLMLDHVSGKSEILEIQKPLEQKKDGQINPNMMFMIPAALERTLYLAVEESKLGMFDGMGTKGKLTAALQYLGINQEFISKGLSGFKDTFGEFIMIGTDQQSIEKIMQIALNVMQNEQKNLIQRLNTMPLFTGYEFGFDPISGKFSCKTPERLLEPGEPQQIPLDAFAEQYRIPTQLKNEIKLMQDNAILIISAVNKLKSDLTVSLKSHAEIAASPQYRPGG